MPFLRLLKVRRWSFWEFQAGGGRGDGWQKQQQQLMTMKAGWTISHSLSSKEETFRRREATWNNDHVGKKCSERQKHCWRSFFFIFLQVSSQRLSNGGVRGCKIYPWADLEWLYDRRTPRNRHSSWGLDAAEGDFEPWHTQSPTVHQAATLY